MYLISANQADPDPRPLIFMAVVGGLMTLIYWGIKSLR